MTYYQDVGNPLQVERLPKRRPPWVTFKPLTSVDELKSLMALVGIGLAIETLIIYVGATNWLPASAWTRTILPVTLGGACLIAALTTGDIAWLLALTAALTCLYPGWPPWFLFTFSAAGLGLLCWRFGQHCIESCLRPPQKRAPAPEQLRAWSGHLRVAALLPLAGGLWCYVQRDVFWPLACLTTVIVLQLVWTLLSPNRRMFVSVVGRSLARWYLGIGWQPGQLEVHHDSHTRAMRLTLSLACLVLVTQAEFLALPKLLGDAATAGLALESGSSAKNYPDSEHDSFSWEMVVLGATMAFTALAAPLAAILLVPLGLVLPVLLEAERIRRSNRPDWLDLVEHIQTSSDPIIRQSIYRGVNAADRTPILVPRSVYNEPSHFLGDSGSGKTSLGLAPTMEQLLYRGDASLIAEDLKGDSLELEATLEVIRARIYRRTGRWLPLKHFSNQANRSTFAFNPLKQSYWRDLDVVTKSDILCGALGLQYGADYGEGFYSSANAAVTNLVLKHYPDVQSFRELAERLSFLLATAAKGELDPEIRKAGIHVLEVFRRLADFEVLNIASPDQAGPDVIEQSIDLAQPFQEPSLMYFHLPASLSPGAAPEIARLVTYLLLAAATQQKKRRHRVYLVIDEFQRMVSRNLAYMLQMARSMDVSLILANQSLQDLKTSKADLIPTVEANCRYREWFSVSSSDDRRRLIESSGETIDFLTNTSKSSSPKGDTTSISRQETILSRFSVNDVLLASDHPHQSIIRISRGADYAQFGGMPVLAENEFHITAEEYERRKSIPWPEGQPGTFVPKPGAGGQGRGDDDNPEPNRSGGPVISGEVIERSKSGKDEPTPEDPFSSYLEEKAKAKTDRRTNRDSQEGKS